MFPCFSYPAAQSVNPAILCLPSFSSHHIKFPQPQLQPKQPNKKMQRQTLRWCGTYEVGGGYPDEGFGAQGKNRAAREQDSSKLEPAQYEALLRGGEQVTSVLEEMIVLLEDMNMDEASEEVAVEIAAQGVLGKRVDEMEASFMMALDYMIQLADSDQDDKRKSLLEVIKETVLSYLTKKCPPHVQVVGLLCRTPLKESRQELLRRVAAGGGVFKSKNDIKVHVPAANLNDIANQADDILETMETRPIVPDRKLLARLVLIREEARNMMGGGILDERNDRGFNTLPESEVNFLTKLVALKPGKTVQEMIKNVMEGKNEGADHSSSDEEDGTGATSGIGGRESISGRKPLPVRPGMFLETVSKVLGGIYGGNVSGITAQHLEWEKVLGSSDPDSGKGKSKMSHHITHGFHLVKGKAHHPMEDYVVAQFKNIDDHELGLFAIFDGHLSHEIPEYLQSNLFKNILKEPDFWTEPKKAVERAYRVTDANILEKAVDLGKGGSTAVTAILIDCQKLVVANVGDSRAIVCKNGVAKQLSVDHEPSTEREDIENRGGFVSNFPGDVPRVDGQLAVARAFGDKSLKKHLSSEPYVMVDLIDDTTEFVVLASDGLWKVMTNQEVVDSIIQIKDARAAAKHLTEEAVKRRSSDDISCIVVRFR